MIQRNGNMSHPLGLEELILLKWPYYPKQSRFNPIPIKLPMTFFLQNQNNPTIYMDPQITPNCQRNSEEKEQRWRQYHKATVIKTAWYWHKKQTHRSMEQNREPENKPAHLRSFNF